MPAASRRSYSRIQRRSLCGDSASGSLTGSRNSLRSRRRRALRPAPPSMNRPNASASPRRSPSLSLRRTVELANAPSPMLKTSETSASNSFWFSVTVTASLDGPLARAHVLGEQLERALLREAGELRDVAVREGAVVDEMADTDRRVAGAVVVGLQAQAFLGHEALQPVGAHPHGSSCGGAANSSSSLGSSCPASSCSVSGSSDGGFVVETEDGLQQIVAQQHGRRHCSALLGR